MSLEGIAETDRESIGALTIVKGEFDIYMLKFKLSKEGRDFEYLTEALNRGVERGLYSAKERDEALEQNEDIMCMYALSMVKKGAPYKLWKPVLDKGVKSALLSRKEVAEAAIDGVQVQYKNLMEEAIKDPRKPESSVIACLPGYCIR